MMSDAQGVARLDALARPTTLLQVLRRHWLPLLLVGLLVGALATELSSRQDPVYESAGEVRLSSSASPFSENTPNARDMERRLLDEVERFRSQAVLELTARRMGDGWDPAEVRRALVVRGDPQVSYIKVAATAGSRTDAGLLVSHSVAAYEQVVTEQLQRDADQTLEQIDAYTDDLSARVEDLRTRLDERRAEFEADMPPLEPVDYTRELERRLALDQTYQGLASRLTSATRELEDLQAQAVGVRLTAALGGSGVEDFEVTRAPTAPVSPAPVRDGLLAGVLAVALGAAVLWARAGRRPAALDVDQTAVALNVPLLARMPRNLPPSVLVGPQDRSMREYARILAAVDFELAVHPSTAAVLTSPVEAAGTSSTVLNVGVLGARQGRSVLIVDADLRHRGLTRALGLEDRPGWSDLGAGVEDLMHCIHEVVIDGVPISVLPAGTARDLRTHPDADTVAEALAGLTEFQLVLLDTAPILVAAETTVTAAQSDNLVLVVPDGCSLPTLQATVVRVSRTGTPVLGLVAARGSGLRRRRHQRRRTDVSVHANTRRPASPAVGTATALAGDREDG